MSLIWNLDFTPQSAKQFKKLDASLQKKILLYFKKDVLVSDDPLVFGKSLHHSWKGFWRFRVEDHRLICRVDKGKLTLLVIKISHRRDVYEM